MEPKVKINQQSKNEHLNLSIMQKIKKKSDKSRKY